MIRIILNGLEEEEIIKGLTLTDNTNWKFCLRIPFYKMIEENLDDLLQIQIHSGYSLKDSTFLGMGSISLSIKRARGGNGALEANPEETGEMGD